MRHERHENIDAQLASLDGFELEATQLDSGPYQCEEIYLSLGDYHFGFVKQTRRLMIRGANAGPGFVFGIPLSDQRFPLHLDYISDTPTVFCLPPGQQIQVITPDNYESVRFYVSVERYHQLLATYFDSPVCCPPRYGLSLYYPSNEQLNGLRKPLLDMRDRIQDKLIIERELMYWLVEATEHAIMPALLQIMANGSDWSVRRRPTLLQLAIELIIDNLDSPPNVNELAHTLGTSPRNLQYMFRNHLGITPKQFIKLYRLNVARQRLWHSHYKRGLVADIANQLGYWHMGGFAQEFRQLFHLNPKEILRAGSIEKDD